MNKYTHFHTYSRFVAIFIFLLASFFVLQKSNIGVAINPDPNEVEIGGWAWNESVGWISLNCKNDFDGDGLLEDTCSTFPYGLEVSATGNVVGCAWGGTSRNADASNTIGYICFSDTSGIASIDAPPFGTHILNNTGYCSSDTGCVDTSDCNVGDDDRWLCLNSVCEVECTAENEATVCGVGNTCNLNDGSNYLCPGNLTQNNSHLESCVLVSSTVPQLPSIVDLEIYSGSENVLYLPRDQEVSSITGWWIGSPYFDLDNPQYYAPSGGYSSYDHPLNGCFNCHQDNIGSCYYRGGWTCSEGDGKCEAAPYLLETCSGAGPKYCTETGIECLVNADCPGVPSGEDYCNITDIEYNCENCLEYFYYDQVNATTSRADQCAYSQVACEYTETSYANGYKYKREIEIGNNTTRTENLVNFPLLLNQEVEYLKHTSKGGDVDSIYGYDIIFSTTTDGSNPLPHELEYYNNRNGKIVAWISVPLLSGSENTIINMFYGNSAISTTTNNTASLWSEYAFVSHMNDITALEVSESVSSTLTGVKAGFNSPTMTNYNYLLGQAQNFDGVNDYIDFGDIANINPPVTLSVWSNITSVDQVPYNFITSDNVASSSPGTAKTGFWLRIFDQLEIGFGDGTNILTRSSNPPLTIGKHHYTGVVSSASSAGMSLYVDGLQINNSTTTVAGTASSVLHNTSTLTVGRREGFGSTEADFNTTGVIDEARISNVARSADWIDAEYKNIYGDIWGDWISIGCQQRYSSSTNGDQFCSCSNPDYPPFGCSASLPNSIDPSCDVCEKHEVNELAKVLGGYNCSLCTIEDFDNSCETNSLGNNRNRCEYCESVYKTPGLMYDNKYNSIISTTTGPSACNPTQDDPSEDDFCPRGNLCGWGINTWRQDDIANFGLGWFQFSPRITSSSRPYFSVESGNIYSKGNIYSRYSPPFGKYNATYLIESGGQITNVVSSSTLSNNYEGELSNRPTLDFFKLLEIGTSKKYKSSLGLIDFTGIVTDLEDGSSFTHDSVANKYGAKIDFISTLDSLDLSLGGSTYVLSSTSTLDNSTSSTLIHIDTWALAALDDARVKLDSSGIIVINGDLNIDRDIYYEDDIIPGSELKITSSKLIPSLVWIVRGDVNIDPAVQEVAGTFIVLGAEGIPCDSITSISCGTFNTGAGGNQLTVNGSVLARQFILNRTYATGGEPSEKFVNTGRLQANPPKGLEDLKKLTPRYSF